MFKLNIPSSSPVAQPERSTAIDITVVGAVSTSGVFSKNGLVRTASDRCVSHRLEPLGNSVISATAKHREFFDKVLKGAQVFAPALLAIYISLSDLPFDFEPASFDIYCAAEPDTLALLDKFAKRIASRSATSVGRARRHVFQQLSHSIRACNAQAIPLRTPVGALYVFDMAC